MSAPEAAENAAAKYTPRLYFEYFNRGIARTYDYELIDSMPEPTMTDQEEHFGLVRNDGTNKPVFTSLKNTITLLEDPGPRFTPKSLDYALSGDTTNVHRTLLQKRDGRFYLVLWKEVSSYNTDTNRDLSVPSSEVTLTLNQQMATAKTYLPTNSVNQVQQYTAPKNLTLNVPDQLLVVELTPSGTSQIPTRSNAPVISKASPE